MNDVEYWIWLQQAIGPGSAAIGQLLEHFGGADNVYRAVREDYLAIKGLRPNITDKLCDKSLAGVQKITDACLKNGYKIITLGDPDYPKRLRNIYAPPCVLYVQGELYPVDDAPLIAVVGTRRITEYGLQAATQLSIGLALCGATVVSGLALGVDTASHKGALKGGGRTIAVIGCGLDINYPAENSELRRLIASNGAVVSEYPPGTSATRFTFPIRNRIIAGLSLGTLVIEAGSRSGSLITAGLAAEMGRDVFAVPGSIFSPLSEGTNKLLRDGAKPVLCVADILEEYIEICPQSINTNIMEKSAVNQNPGEVKETEPEPEQLMIDKMGTKKRKAPQSLTKTQAAVYDILDGSPLHVDDISLRLNLETRVVLGVLTILEIQGLAKSYPGRRFASV